MAIDFNTLEALMRQDPGGRGIASYRHEGGWLASGMFEPASRDLASSAGAVAIVTGFCVADVDPPVAETDGPPGALYLARALQELGREVVLVCDGSARTLLELGRRLWRLDLEIKEMPLGRSQEAFALEDCLTSRWNDRLTHIIAVERVGPSHTLSSLGEQRTNSAAAIARFEREVPPEHRGVCHNMRGIKIDDYTAPAHRLFEKSGLARGMTTIGIGDGGNEIGMGSLAWQELRGALKGEHAGRIICRVATDFLILAGVSNWGAYALACAVAGLRGQSERIARWDEEAQRELIEVLVRDGGAVDGLTRRREPTVDGLSLDLYLGVLRQIRRACQEPQ